MDLPEVIKVLKKEGNKAIFEISPLSPGYGSTIANPLRRVLLSSMKGAAITSIKIDKVDHEFTSIPGIQEDLIQLILNVKRIRFKSFTEESVKVTLSIKGEREITAADLKVPTDLELVTPNQHIATITDKKKGLEMELTIENGIGYVPLEERQKEKLPIGVIAVDAIFSPVILVNFRTEDIRVGQRIDYNRVVLEIETDGSVEPELALKNASEILVDHFKVISEVPIPEKKDKPKKSVKKASKKSKK